MSNYFVNLKNLEIKLNYNPFKEDYIYNFRQRLIKLKCHIDFKAIVEYTKLFNDSHVGGIGLIFYFIFN